MMKISTKKIAGFCTILLALAVFAGAGIVLASGGRQNAGICVVPMVFCLVSLQWYRSLKD